MISFLISWTEEFMILLFALLITKGYRGCPNGTYGSNCLNKCSVFCESLLCDEKTGDCLLCVIYRNGPKCEGFDCPNGTYGEECLIQCSDFCVDQLCESLTGNCFACIKHHTGPKCENYVYEQSKHIAWYFLLLLLIIPICCTMPFLIKKKSHFVSDDESYT